MARIHHTRAVGTVAPTGNPQVLRAGGVVVVLAVALATWMWFAPLVPPDERKPPAGQSVGPPDLDPAFAPSQHDTAPDGDLRRATSSRQAGAALPYAELRRMFDYYLSTLGERELPAILGQIQAQLDQQLRPAQIAPARRLLDAYIAFKRALVHLEARPGLSGQGLDAIRSRMLAQQDLRSQFFSRLEIDSMFGLEDAYDADALARLEVSQNPSLTVQQKQGKLAALDAALPAALRADRDATVKISRVEQRAAVLRDQGASDDDIYRLRAKEFDPAAAARLADVDREEAAWAQRIAAYLQARAVLMAAPTPTDAAERQQVLLALQQRMFSAEERLRLVAYEPPPVPTSPTSP